MYSVYRNSWLPEVFNDFLSNAPMTRTNATAPAINVKETADEYVVELAAPGMKKENFDISINGEGDLTIKMDGRQEKKEEETKAHYLRREFAYSKYEQTLILPEDVNREHIAASMTDGILTINLPKMKQEERKVARQIAIS